jgi:hypothetical protein
MHHDETHWQLVPCLHCTAPVQLQQIWGLRGNLTAGARYAWRMSAGREHPITPLLLGHYQRLQLTVP